MTQLMTEKQLAAWPGLVERARVYGASEIRETGYGWTLHFEDEVRPGRGCDLKAIFCDGDNFVYIALDVYGSGSVSVADVDWLHADDDEECYCDRCVAERAKEEEVLP